MGCHPNQGFHVVSRCFLFLRSEVVKCVFQCSSGFGGIWCWFLLCHCLMCWFFAKPQKASKAGPPTTGSSLHLSISKTDCVSILGHGSKKQF